MAEEKQSKRLALVVGVNRAPQSQKAPLLHARQDAEEMAKTLREPYCSFDDVTLFQDEQALTGTIQDAFTEAISQASGPEDLLLFYFAGHAVQMTRPQGNPEVFLVTHDFNHSLAARNPTRYISLSWLRDMLYDNMTKTGNIVLILDNCYAAFMIEQPIEKLFVESTDFAQLSDIFNDRFLLRGEKTRPSGQGLRRVFAATHSDKQAEEREGHGVMTQHILSALQGKERSAKNDEGQVTVARLYPFLQDKMFQNGLMPLDYQGTDRNRPPCVLAYHDPETSQTAQLRPSLLYFVPRELSQHFQAREGEFAQLLAKLKSAPGKPLGLIGMPGIGKSELASQFAEAHKADFPDGVYWVDVSEQTATDRRLELWWARFASLARKLDYRPSSGQNDDEPLASHLAVYLARSPRALLILDGVEEPREITKLLAALAGRSMECAILFTSVKSIQSEDSTIYRVPELTDPQAYHLLLPDQRSDILNTLLQDEPMNDEAAAARAICNHLANHPLALTVLRAFLEDEPELTLRLLANELGQKDFFGLTKEAQISASVEDMFTLVWGRIANADAEWLFKLLAYYPESAAIPLWLAGLTANLGEDGGIFSPLHKAWKRLHNLSLVTYVSDLQLLQFHPMLRSFGKRLTSKAEDKQALREAGQQLVRKLEDLSLLERRACLDYWTCLDQFRAAISYIRVLADRDAARELVPIERALDRESYVLAGGNFWPQRFPALFYQQIANRLAERQNTSRPRGNPPQSTWLALRSRLRTGSSAERQRILAGHTKEVTSVTFSPDGTEILTASEDGEAHILDTSSGRILAHPRVHAEGIISAAFSPTGTFWLTAARDGTVTLWSWERAFFLAQRITSFSHPTEVNCVAFAPDGRSFLTGARDGLARLWDSETGTLVQAFAGHDRAITSVAFSPDGQTILTGSGDQTVRLWERASGRVLQILRSEIKYEFPYTPFFANSQTGQKIPQAVDTSIRPEERFVTSVAFSPDGLSVLAGYNDGRAWLWEISSGQVARFFAHSSVEVASVTFSPDGRLLLTGAGDGAVRVFSAETGYLLTMFRGSGRIKSTVFSPDGKSLLAGSNDHRVLLWSLPEQVLRNVRTESRAPLIFVTSVALGTVVMPVQGQMTPLRRVLAGFENGEVWLWEETPQGSLRLASQTPAQNSSVASLALAADGHTFLAGYEDGFVRRWEIFAQARTRRLSLQYELQHRQEVTTTLYVPDSSSMLSTAQDGKAYVWTSRKSREADLTVTHPDAYSGPITCASVSPNGRQLLLGLADGQIILTATKRKEEKRRWPAHTGLLTGLAFLPGDRYVISSGMDTRTYLWDSQDGTLVIELTEQTEEVGLFVPSPQNNLLLACNNRGNLVRLWSIDLSASTPVCTLLGLYATHAHISTALWLGKREFLLADTGDTSCRPSLYWMRVENLA